jgi:hypothetical protein
MSKQAREGTGRLGKSVPSPAMVVALLALFVALGGSAIAARHYLINSTKQISPKVLAKLKGNAGPPGPAGTGAAGKEGARGKEGAAGKEGAKGQDLTSHTPLPSGQSESGHWAVANGSSTTGYVSTSVSFSQPLAAAIPAGHVVYNERETTSTHCSGAGKADAGFVCLYAQEQSAGLTLNNIFGFKEASMSADQTGFSIYFEDTAAGFADGVWTVTAP